MISSLFSDKLFYVILFLFFLVGCSSQLREPESVIDDQYVNSETLSDSIEKDIEPGVYVTEEKKLDDIKVLLRYPANIGLNAGLEKCQVWLNQKIPDEVKSSNNYTSLAVVNRYSQDMIDWILTRGKLEYEWGEKLGSSLDNSFIYYVNINFRQYDFTSDDFGVYTPKSEDLISAIQLDPSSKMFGVSIDDVGFDIQLQYHCEFWIDIRASSSLDDNRLIVEHIGNRGAYQDERNWDLDINQNHKIDFRSYGEFDENYSFEVESYDDTGFTLRIDQK